MGNNKVNTLNISSITKPHLWSEEKLQFTEDFSKNSNFPKYILGRNIYAESVAKFLEVDGFIDDFTDHSKYLGSPILKTSEVPKNSLVLNVSGGRPLSARENLNRHGLKNIDYFAFNKISNLKLTPIRFNEGFEDEFLANKDKYQWAYQLLMDNESRHVYEKLVHFRFKNDLKYLEGFSQREDVQYFEDFLNLQANGETFFDVGCFDGYTSLEFIKKCPNFNSVIVFEPDIKNFKNCKHALKDKENITFFPIGLSNSRRTLRFNISGSASSISDQGSVEISVDRLDDVTNIKPTFIKIDIEGGESSAIEGAKKTIKDNHPRLAISAYHSAGDFWSIPEQILAIRDDYEVYMRHYTECIYETVLFFIPIK